MLGALWCFSLFVAPGVHARIVPTYESVDLQSEPRGATVTVSAGSDVIAEGITPCQLSLHPGRYDVELAVGGYRLWKGEGLEVPGDWYKDPIKLQALDARLNITVKPPEANPRLFVDGVEVNPTGPGIFSLPVSPRQTHTLVIEADKYRRIEKKVTPAPGATIPITHDLRSVGLGDLRDFCLATGSFAHLVAPVCEPDLEYAWEVDGASVATGAALDWCFWYPGTYLVSLTVTTPGGEQQTTECYCHVADSFRASDPAEDALATWTDLRVVEIAFAPVFESDRFVEYEATVILRLGGAPPEPPDGSSLPIQYRVELTSGSGSAVVRNAVCLIGETGKSRNGSTWTWRKEWQVHEAGRWTVRRTFEVAPLDRPNSANTAVRVRIPGDFDPNNLSAWRACVLVGDFVVDEIQATGLAPSQ
jgi:hypothetical protein